MNTQDTWETRFDVYWSEHDICCGGDFHKGINHPNRTELEELIRTEIQAAEQRKVAEIREKVKELGHQQEDDTIWCDMDQILSLLQADTTQTTYE